MDGKEKELKNRINELVSSMYKFFEINEKRINKANLDELLSKDYIEFAYKVFHLVDDFTKIESIKVYDRNIFNVDILLNNTEDNILYIHELELNNKYSTLESKRIYSILLETRKSYFKYINKMDAILKKEIIRGRDEYIDKKDMEYILRNLENIMPSDKIPRA